MKGDELRYLWVTAILIQSMQIGHSHEFIRLLQAFLLLIPTA